MYSIGSGGKLEKEDLVKTCKTRVFELVENILRIQNYPSIVYNYDDIISLGCVDFYNLLVRTNRRSIELKDKLKTE